MEKPVLDPVRAAFRALAVTVVPDAAQLDPAAWDSLERIVENALRPRPPRLRRQLITLIRLFEWLPVLRFGRPFTRLDPARRTRFLAAIANAPLLLVRRGFWGLKTLILMGYYARAEAAGAIGYRAAAAGWAARR